MMCKECISNSEEQAQAQVSSTQSFAFQREVKEPEEPEEPEDTEMEIDDDPSEPENTTTTLTTTTDSIIDTLTYKLQSL